MKTWCCSQAAALWSSSVYLIVGVTTNTMDIHIYIGIKSLVYYHPIWFYWVWLWCERKEIGGAKFRRRIYRELRKGLKTIMILIWEYFYLMTEISTILSKTKKTPALVCFFLLFLPWSLYEGIIINKKTGLFTYRQLTGRNYLGGTCRSQGVCIQAITSTRFHFPCK